MVLESKLAVLALDIFRRGVWSELKLGVVVHRCDLRDCEDLAVRAALLREGVYYSDYIDWLLQYAAYQN